MLTAEEIEDALAPGYEQRGLELKGPGSRSDKHLFAKVTRAALSMGNLQDGGHIVIGIDDDDPAAMLPGVGPADLDSWLAYDDVARAMAAYADPPLRIDVDRRDLPSGVSVAVIQIFEFADVPHICSKDYPNVLRNGALYVRTRRLPETSEVPTSVEMREVLDLATRKSLRAYVKAAEDAGVTLTTHERPTDRASYDAEAERAWQ